MSNATSMASGTTVHRPLRSAVAVVVGFLSVAVFSLATDQVLHVVGVYPPWGEPMYDTGLNLLALLYRDSLHDPRRLHHGRPGAARADAPRDGCRGPWLRRGHGWGDCSHEGGESWTQLVSDCARDYGAPVCLARWGDSWRQAIWEVRPLA